LTRYHHAAAAAATVDASTDRQSSSSSSSALLLLHCVSIQYPDPHFKKAHAKRRVVTPGLVQTIAKFMPPQTGTVFLQSDIQSVLDDMRNVFLEMSPPQYFELDTVLHKDHDYLPQNPLGVPTEREVSVLDKHLPVYRVLLRRTQTVYQEEDATASDNDE
jgi:tRNA (guanine-N7-)-methyltransferase